MLRFLTIAFVIWGGTHLYVLLRIWAYAGMDRRGLELLALVIVLLMACPIVGMMLGRRGHAAVAGILRHVGMIWMGLFFLFFCISLVHDSYNLILTVLRWILPAAGSARLLGHWPIIAELVIVGLIGLYSLYEADHIVTERVRVETGKLPSGIPRMRIVQISDLHLGPMVGEGRLARIVKAVREAKPDLLVCTGDLVDADMRDSERLAGMLRGLEAPMGKFAVTGNHEYYAGLDMAINFTRRCGFTVLSNETVRLWEGITVAGFDDERAHRSGDRRWDEAAILRAAAEGGFMVVLKHRPWVREESISLMDLQLSGHTHRGQIFPFSLGVIAHYDYPHGLCEVGVGTFLYTSRGAGTWGPPMRFLNPPEVTVIDLVRAGG